MSSVPRKKSALGKDSRSGVVKKKLKSTEVCNVQDHFPNRFVISWYSINASYVGNWIPLIEIVPPFGVHL